MPSIGASGLTSKLVKTFYQTARKLKLSPARDDQPIGCNCLASLDGINFVIVPLIFDLWPGDFLAALFLIHWPLIWPSWCRLTE